MTIQTLEHRGPSERIGPGDESRRRRPRCWPQVEGLEGRALMSYGGTPDVSFGPGGAVALPPIANQAYQATASAVQADGKVVVVGRLKSVPNGISQVVEIVAARYQADGSIDPSFGANGYFTSPALSTVSTALAPLDASASQVAIQADGKIVVVGNVADGAKAFRLDAGGALDPAFGLGGIASLGSLNVLGHQLNYATSVALAPGGKIAVGGSDTPLLGQDVAAVELLNANGSADLSFGVGGVADIPQSYLGLLKFLPIVPVLSSGVVLPGSPVNVAAQADGRIIVVANASPNGTAASSLIASTRFGADGTVDHSYGNNGATLVTTATLYISNTGSTVGTTATLQADGKLVIGGSIVPTSGATQRLLAVRLGTDGLLDPSFGGGGANVPGGITPQPSGVGSLAIQADGKIVLADAVGPDFVRLGPGGTPDPTFGGDGTALATVSGAGSVGVAITTGGKILATRGGTSPGLLRLLGRGSTGDYDGDGLSDPSLYLTSQGSFSDKPSGGAISPTIPFGTPGPGLTLPAPGAYAGGGTSELAVYLTTPGAFAVRPGHGLPDIITQFGAPGLGNSIPAQGDYDASGKTEYAVYLPNQGTFAYRPAGGGPDVFVSFGTAGPGKSTPIPADYFGTGRSDIAVYLVDQGAYAIRNPATGQDSIIPFGIPGLGNSIPVPGDYDGSGKAELAIYLPSQALLIYRPAGGGPDVAMPFGVPGPGQTLPAPGDYDGSGKTEVAAYIPSQGLFAYRPAKGGGDVAFAYGTPNQAIPFVASSATLAAGTGGPDTTVQADSASPPVEVPLTPDVLEWIAGPSARKPSRTP